MEQNLIKEKNELLDRMQSKVNLLKEDKEEIHKELSENSQEIDVIMGKIRDAGSIMDADKMKLHIEELESVTSLTTVLKVRLKTTQNKLELTKEPKEKVSMM